MDAWIAPEALMSALAFPLLALFTVGSFSFPPPPRPFILPARIVGSIAALMLSAAAAWWIVDLQSLNETFWLLWGGLILLSISGWLSRSKDDPERDDDWPRGDGDGPLSPPPPGGGGVDLGKWDWDDLDRHRREWEASAIVGVGEKR